VNGTSCSGENPAPAPNSSYWVRVFENALPSTTIAVPLKHRHQAQVEHQVPGLAQVAALGGDRAVLPADPVATCPQVRLRGVQDGGRGGLDHAGRVAGQPRQPSGAGVRERPELAQVHRRPRHDAADQRDEQQQVDGGEPRRAEHVEEAEPAEPRPVVGVLAQEVGHPHRVRRTLGHQRAGHGRDPENEQQDQRRAHRGERGPGEAQPADQVLH
jgi:hypothetical protein